MKIKVMFTVKCHTFVERVDYPDGSETTLEDIQAYELDNAAEYVAEALAMNGATEIEVEVVEEE